MEDIKRRRALDDRTPRAVAKLVSLITAATLSLYAT